MNMEFTEVLISLVRQQPCLYDTRIKDFKNIFKKDRIWEQIATQMDQNIPLAFRKINARRVCDVVNYIIGNNIKMKWKNLKDGYAKYRKKKNKYENWIWGPYMTFLDGTGSIRMKTTDPASQSPNNAEGEEVKAEAYSFREDDDDLEESNPSNSLHEFLSLRDPLSSNPRKRRASDDYTDDKFTVQYNTEEKDSIDLLFQSYAKSLKKLKPKTQAAVKIKLAQIFADAELEEYNSDNQNRRDSGPVYSVLSTNDSEVYPSSSRFDNIKTD